MMVYMTPELFEENLPYLISAATSNQTSINETIIDFGLSNAIISELVVPNVIS